MLLNIPAVLWSGQTMMVHEKGSHCPVSLSKNSGENVSRLSNFLNALVDSPLVLGLRWLQSSQNQMIGGGPLQLHLEMLVAQTPAESYESNKQMQQMQTPVPAVCPCKASWLSCPCQAVKPPPSLGNDKLLTTSWGEHQKMEVKSSSRSLCPDFLRYPPDPFTPIWTLLLHHSLSHHHGGSWYSSDLYLILLAHHSWVSKWVPTNRTSEVLLLLFLNCKTSQGPTQLFQCQAARWTWMHRLLTWGNVLRIGNRWRVISHINLHLNYILWSRDSSLHSSWKIWAKETGALQTSQDLSDMRFAGCNKASRGGWNLETSQDWASSYTLKSFALAPFPATREAAPLEWVATHEQTPRQLPANQSNKDTRPSSCHSGLFCFWNLDWFWMLLRVRGTKFWIFQSHSHSLILASWQAWEGPQGIWTMTTTQKELKHPKGSKKSADDLQEFQTIPREYVLGGILPTGLWFGRRLLGRCMTQTCAAHGTFVAVWPLGGNGDAHATGMGGGSGWAECWRSFDLHTCSMLLNIMGMWKVSVASQGPVKSRLAELCLLLIWVDLLDLNQFCFAWQCWMTLTTCAIHATFMKCHR